MKRTANLRTFVSSIRKASSTLRSTRRLQGFDVTLAFAAYVCVAAAAQAILSAQFRVMFEAGAPKARLRLAC